MATHDLTLEAHPAGDDSANDPRAHEPLAPLRDDLRLEPARLRGDGEPAWTIQDPVTNRFYRIGWLEFEALLRWGQSPGSIAQQIAAQTALSPSVDQILALADFLERHHLIRPTPQATERLAAQQENRRPWQSPGWWLHHYLFFRVPLIRPQRPLAAMASALGWLFTPLVAWLIVALGLTGIVLVVKRWDLFTHSVVEAFSMSGILSFACALVVAKSLHELGHALVATRLGVKVAHMGVAFIVLWPMLYTDTGESWKLRHSRQRLAISSAGILTELALAGLATLGWALTSQGPLNSALLYLATTSWVLSLALNASPFMRFDGYFILTDLLDFPNLHERAGGQARIWLRRRLLGLDEPWPEPFSRSRRRALVAFAFATWVYRLVLFLGIAVAVYLLFFKALGIVLFAVEIAWFIVLPVAREVSHWWSRRRAVPRRFRLAWLLVGLVLLALVALPWQTRVGGPGSVHAEREVTLYTPFPARLEQRHANGDVEAGAALASLSDPGIRLDLDARQASVANMDAQLTGLLGNPDGRRLDSATRARLGLGRRSVEAAQSEITRLTLAAPFAGRWQNIDGELAAGQWVGPQEPLGVLIDPEHWIVDGYVDQDEVHRLRVGNRVRFFVEGRSTPLDGELIDIAPTRTRLLEQPMLAERHGGPLVTVSDSAALRGSSSLVLERPLFAVRARLDPPWEQGRQARGRLHVEAERRSLAGQFTTWVAAIAIRESGF
ncbi:HlyD family efflux transporter periplasmic adaptor subunit [Halomonas sp. V046]|uniref:HlyD family efflux transporter periplasmic adaptor subunit n=1 Tax=Halomonas sp. V046 TaxID=3459611 RepID=UPI0040449C72